MNPKLLLSTLAITFVLAVQAFAALEIKYLYPDGSLKTIYGFTPVSPEEDIAYAVSESDNPAGGGPFHVIIGVDLAKNPTSQTYSIVASHGVLICQNVLDPE